MKRSAWSMLTPGAGLALLLLAGLAGLFVYLHASIRRAEAQLQRVNGMAAHQTAEMRKSTKRVETHIVNLYNAIESPRGAGPETPPRWFNATIGNTAREYILFTEAPTGGTVTVRNVGATRINDIVMSVNGNFWFRSFDTVPQIAPKNASDREKAFRLWHYLCSNTYNWLPPDSHGPESNNAQRVLSVYGYGQHPEIAAALVQLADAADIKGRIRLLEGYEVPELFFDGGWHVMDPSMRVFYPDPANNGEPASVEDCGKESDLVENVLHLNGEDGGFVADLYRTQPNSEASSQSFRSSALAFRLHPSEEMSFQWVPVHWLHMVRQQRGLAVLSRPIEANPGPLPWHAGAYATRPPYLGKATFRGDYLTSKPAARALLLEGAEFAEMPMPGSREKNPATRLFVVPEKANAAATVTLQIGVPFVITSARAVGHFMPSAVGDTLRVQIIASEEVLAERLMTADSTERPLSASAVLTAGLSGEKKPGRYNYQVRVQMKVKTPGEGGLFALRVETQCQCTPFLPWRLVAGENRVIARTAGEDTKADLFFTWHDSQKAQRFLGGPSGVRAEKATDGRLQITWSPPATSDGMVPEFYEVNLSDHDDFAWPAVPGAFNEVEADTCEWTPPAPFPVRPGAYYFRARARNVFGHSSPWSETLKLSTP